MATETSRVDQGPTVTAGQIAAELQSHGSPMAPYAQHIYDAGVASSVDPAFFLAVVWGENHYGTVGAARTTYNWASISNALYGGVPVEGNRWGQYPSPEAGIDAFFQLLPAEYYPLGQRDIFSIWWGVGGTSHTTGQHAYAPAFENAPGSIDTVVGVMNHIAGRNAVAVPTPTTTPVVTPPAPVVSIPGLPDITVPAPVNDSLNWMQKNPLATVGIAVAAIFVINSL